MVQSSTSPDLLKRLALVQCIASLYRVYGRKHSIFLFNSLVQLVSSISEQTVDGLLNQIVMGKLNPAFFDSYEI